LHLADLQDAGFVRAAGPLQDDHFRGLVILDAPPEIARRLIEQDSAVRAGRFDAVVMPWLVPSGVLRFGSASLLHSVPGIE
jgi:hypothetical protein